MRALVTGANGFVGRHLRAHLEGVGDQVYGLDVECDVTDRQAVVARVGQVEPDVIYHLAALSHVGRSWERPEDYTRVNVLGTINVLHGAHEAALGATVVVISSADVYGVVAEKDLPLRETHPPVPANPYAQSKLEAELAAREAVRTRGQRVVIARPFNHVGPGQSVDFVVPALVDRLLDARERSLDQIAVGDLSTRRDFSDVRDVVRAYRLLALYGVTGDVYNVASGHDVALYDLAVQLVERIAPSVRLEVEPGLLRPVEVPVMRGDFEKLHVATGWEPSIDLATSLADVIDDLIARRGAR